MRLSSNSDIIQIGKCAVTSVLLNQVVRNSERKVQRLLIRKVFSSVATNHRPLETLCTICLQQAIRVGGTHFLNLKPSIHCTAQHSVQHLAYVAAGTHQVACNGWSFDWSFFTLTQSRSRVNQSVSRNSVNFHRNVKLRRSAASALWFNLHKQRWGTAALGFDRSRPANFGKMPPFFHIWSKICP